MTIWTECSRLTKDPSQEGVGWDAWVSMYDFYKSYSFNPDLRSTPRPSQVTTFKNFFPSTYHSEQRQTRNVASSIKQLLHVNSQQFLY